MINLSGNMCSVRISQRKTYINLLAVVISLNGINIIFLVNLSTVTIIKLNTTFVIDSFNSDNLTIKSIDTELHSFLSTYNSYSNPYSLCLGVFIL